MIKVAFIYPHSDIPVPPVALGDALAIVTHELTRRLAKTCEVFVYPRRKHLQRRLELYEGVTFNRIAVWPDQLIGQLRILDGLVWQNPQRPFRISNLYYPFYARKVASDVRRRQCQIVHLYAIPSLIPPIRRQNPQVKIVVHAHDHLLYQFDRQLVLERLQRADLILGCSRFVAENIRRRFPELAGRCEVLYNGVDFSRFASPTVPRIEGGDGCKVLFVGRLSPEKGIHILLEAFRRVASRNSTVTLELVGPSTLAPKQFVDPFNQDPMFRGVRRFYQRPKSYLAHLKTLVRGQIAERVFFSGPIPNRHLAEHYRQADIFVFPSLWQEPFGMPITEAMATGLPVIATAGGAFPELIEDGKTGFLVARGEVPALVEALSRLIANPKLRQAMGAAAQQRAQALFSWDQKTAELLGHYQRLLGIRSAT